jgi:hypothetical protein
MQNVLMQSICLYGFFFLRLYLYLNNFVVTKNILIAFPFFPLLSKYVSCILKDSYFKDSLEDEFVLKTPEFSKFI